MTIHHTVALAAIAPGPACPSFAQDPGKPASAKAAADARSMDNAMTPGDYQKRLEPMVGTFDVRF